MENCEKAVPLQCVFHSIRFKVNKGWSTAVLLFLCLIVNNLPSDKYQSHLLQSNMYAVDRFIVIFSQL
ncbi:hypothetical protein DWW69_17785 [Bacteroides sp. AF16-49]|nr:hypothetical protein DXB63_15470 [Bacteroides sp. OM05-12]RHR71244.1 hypothetical protein DWW69_17785 [Bacteroides sp. AF16-49]